jgi:hypothetical protein
MSACWECGGSPPLHDHHVVPRSRGGTRTVPLCEPCHGLAHDRDLRIAELTQAALQAKRRKGERIGQIPFGYQLAEDGVRLVEHPGEQRAASEVRRLRSTGLSQRAIVDHMNAHHLGAARGRAWHLPMIQRLLKATTEGDR